MVIEQSFITVTVTDKAAEKAKAILTERGVADAALRLFVAGGGCSGYQYGMAIARNREAYDIEVECNGVPLLIDSKSALLLDGAEIDYVDDLMKSGFTISNPNAVNTCACGNSFQTADGSGTPRACNS
jgi:iron-sulfur cluster assembly protein